MHYLDRLAREQARTVEYARLYKALRSKNFVEAYMGLDPYVLPYGPALDQAIREAIKQKERT
jgi:hypothetical protein